MKRRVFVLLALLLSLAAADFGKWWSDFQTAVTRKDTKAIAQGVHFPLNWENGPIREIKSEADLAKNFDAYFTPEIRKSVATRKPERMPNGVYSVTWKARGNEYSLYFKPEGATFVLDGLSEGPA